MSELLEMLLSADCPNVAKKLPEKKIEVKTLSARLGKPAVFTVRALPYGKVQELRQVTDEKKASLHILLHGCADPDWKDPALLNPSEGIATPFDAMQSKLLAGEIEDVSREIERLSGFRMNTVREIKNG